MKIKKIISKLAENRISSFWYKGDGTILKAKKNGRTFIVEPRGEIEVFFPSEDEDEETELFKDENAVTEALNRDYTDDDLNSLDENDGWRMNNWFVIIEVNDKGEDVSDDLGICYDYDEVIEMLTGIVNEA